MSERVSLGGVEMTQQAAIDALSEQLAALRAQRVDVPADEHGPLLQALTNNLTDQIRETRSRPNFDLVGTLETFDGQHPDHVDDFFRGLEGVGALSNWGEDEKLRIAFLKVTGSAGRFIKSVDQEKISNYEAFKATLTARYREKLPRDSYFQQLSVIQQRAGENAEAYADRVRALNEKTIRITDSADVNAALREEANRRALDAYLRGLYGPVGEQTRLKFPKTLDEALSTAIAMEHLLNKSDTRSVLRQSDRRVFWAGATACNEDSDTNSSTLGSAPLSPSTGSLSTYDCQSSPSCHSDRRSDRGNDGRGRDRNRDLSRGRSPEPYRNRSRERYREGSRGREHSQDRGWSPDLYKNRSVVHYQERNTRGRSPDRYGNHSREGTPERHYYRDQRRVRDTSRDRFANYSRTERRYDAPSDRRHEPGAPSQRDRDTNFPARNQPPVECWWCQKKGHTQAVCFARLSNRPKVSRRPDGPYARGGQPSGNGNGVAAGTAKPPPRK